MRRRLVSWRRRCCGALDSAACPTRWCGDHSGSIRDGRAGQARGHVLGTGTTRCRTPQLPALVSALVRRRRHEAEPGSRQPPHDGVSCCRGRHWVARIPGDSEPTHDLLLQPAWIRGHWCDERRLVSANPVHVARCTLRRPGNPAPHRAPVYRRTRLPTASRRRYGGLTVPGVTVKGICTTARPPLG